jgi:hypothetical protein
MINSVCTRHIWHVVACCFRSDIGNLAWYIDIIYLNDMKKKKQKVNRVEF